MTGYAGFERYVVTRRDALLRTAYLLTGNHHDAEDLVQAALIKVVPRWDRIQDRPDGYVRQVLVRESVNRWRGRRWREVTTDRVPEAVHRDSTERVALLQELRTLSPRQRAVLVLRYFEDLTEAETAATLGISVGSVKSHSRDALARLRSRQQPDDEQSAAATGSRFRRARRSTSSPAATNPGPVAAGPGPVVTQPRVELPRVTGDP